MGLFLFVDYGKRSRTTWVWDKSTHNMGWVGVVGICPSWKWFVSEIKKQYGTILIFFKKHIYLFIYAYDHRYITFFKKNRTDFS